MMEEYTIYGILCETIKGKQLNVVCAGKNAQQAIGFLEDSLEQQGYKSETIKDMNLIAKNTGYKSNKEGLIFGFNSFTDSLF